jgi:CelD/BcsL family acetyltransferase involved in cellulose biosynthesis
LIFLTSYEDGELSRFGPGRAHLQEIIRRAIRKGHSHFDFTVGDESYKLDWSDVRMPLYGYFAATTPLGLPALIWAVTFRRTKRMIKQNALLWRGFNRMRQRFAARNHAPRD